jgi:hypothetical protein
MDYIRLDQKRVELLMATITSDQFQAICSGVWNDRAAVLSGRGLLTGEAALIRAVYWRLCKDGVFSRTTLDNYASAQSVLTYEVVAGCVLEMNAKPYFDGAPYLEDLRDRYQTEFGRNC